MEFQLLTFVTWEVFNLIAVKVKLFSSKLEQISKTKTESMNSLRVKLGSDLGKPNGDSDTNRDLGAQSRCEDEDNSQVDSQMTAWNNGPSGRPKEDGAKSEVISKTTDEASIHFD